MYVLLVGSSSGPVNLKTMQLIFASSLAGPVNLQTMHLIFASSLAALRSENNDWLAWKQDNVFK